VRAFAILLAAAGGWLVLTEGMMAARRAEWAASAAGAADLVARTIWGEARGEGAEGMAAVANVIVNRVRRPGWWGRDIVSVCLRPGQFSAWNVTDLNRLKMLTVTADDPAFAVALDIARQAVAGQLPDTTGGATHYHATGIEPAWAKTGTVSARIGRHLFYTGVA